jgi:flavodoxin
MYTITPNQSLMTWALAHGWCSQRCTASSPVEVETDLPIRYPAQAPIAASPLPPTHPTPTVPETRLDGQRMSVLVVYESHHNRAGSVVNAIADAAATRGVSALIRTIGNVTPADVDRTDAVIAGCWMPGHAPLSSESTRNMMDWIDDLGPMKGKPVGLFCTYRFFPYTFADVASRTARMERELTARFERKGANVVAKRLIYFKSINEEAVELVRSVLERVGSTLEPDTAPDDLRRTA